MNTLKIIKKLETLQTKMPDIVIRKMRVGLFKHAYVIMCQTVSSSDRLMILF